MPLEMARACPGRCEEQLAQSSLRGRALLEGVLSPKEAEVLAEFAHTAMELGNGYRGAAQPLTASERSYGVTLPAAVQWVLKQPRDGGQRGKAMAGASMYVRAVEKLQRAVGEHFGLAPDANLLDFEHLTCREQAGEADLSVAYSAHDGYLYSGNDILAGEMTLAEARERCAGLPRCVGFTLKGREGSPPEGPTAVYLKEVWNLAGAGASSGWMSFRRDFSVAAPASASDAESHPIRADNCCRRGRLCQREHSCRAWRTHSAVLFLHGPDSGDFTGGSFFFTPTWDSPEADRVHVEPRSGRALAFTSGAENLHGDSAVTAGKRCALSIWLTDDAELAGAKNALADAEESLSKALQGEAEEDRSAARQAAAGGSASDSARGLFSEEL